MRSFVALFFAVLWAGCGLNKFDETLTDQATIPGRLMTGQMLSPMYAGAFSSGLDLSSDKTFQNNNVSPSQVDGIFVKSVHIEGTNPGVDDLGAILQSLTIWVEAPSVARMTIATGTNFPMGAAADLSVMSMVNLKPYAVSSMMKVGTDLVLKQPPAFPTTIKTTVHIEVDIHIPGT